MTTVELNQCRQYIKNNYDPETGLTVNVKYEGHTSQRRIKVDKIISLNDRLTIYPDKHNIFTYTFIKQDTVIQQFQNPIL